MSYILEALRRAESERERKRRIPGLLAQPVPTASPDERDPRRSKAWLWVVIGVAAGVLLPALWHAWTLEPIPDEVAAAARAPVAGSVTPQTSSTAPAAAMAAPASPPAVPAVAPAPAAPAVVEPPAPTRSARTRPAASVAATKASAAAHPVPRVAAAPPAASAGPVAVAATPSAAAAPEPKLRSLNEMPEDVRRAVPPLAFGGSVYSEIAAQRMVILNGQVLREGDAVTDELQLEQIRPRSAVMRLRGQRFEITF